LTRESNRLRESTYTGKEFDGQQRERMHRHRVDRKAEERIESKTETDRFRERRTEQSNIQ